MAQMRLISIGGGGFTHNSHPDLDAFCLRHTVPAPRIGYVGVASNDDQTKLDRFYQHFDHHGAALEHLPLTASGAYVADWLKSVELVYFGGDGVYLRNLICNVKVCLKPEVLNGDAHFF